jgi:hypothetical protein
MINLNDIYLIENVLDAPSLLSPSDIDPRATLWVAFNKREGN